MKVVLNGNKKDMLKLAEFLEDQLSNGEFNVWYEHNKTLGKLSANIFKQFPKCVTSEELRN